jgi:pimeloyl-ACP methyl ester carboxylesterase
MDEASSKFVDQLVMSKLVGEKLAKVSHRPDSLLSDLRCTPFDGFTWEPETASVGNLESAEFLTFQSPFDSEYEVNRTVNVIAHEVQNPRGGILLLHGLFEDNRQIYAFLIGELLRLGFSVFQLTLPFHYERTPSESLFSGEFFLSADLRRTRNAFRQAVLELQKCYARLQERMAVPLNVVGFSMGGAIALIAEGLTRRFSRLCLINPATRITELIWTQAICQPIAADLKKSGADRTEIDEVLRTFDPFSLSPDALNPSKIQMIFGQFDLVTLPAQYEELCSYFDLNHVLRYKSGHLNMLRVPRLAEDIVRFFTARENDAQRATGSVF